MLIVLVVVLVSVAGLVLISLALFVAFILWLGLKKNQMEQRSLIEPNYSDLVHQRTIQPLLEIMSSASTSLPSFVSSVSKNVLEEFTQVW